MTYSSQDDRLYFEQAALVPAVNINCWRMVRLSPGLVRVTVYEQSIDSFPKAEGSVERELKGVLHVRGAFVMTMEGFEAWVKHAVGLVEMWAQAQEVPKSKTEMN